MSQQQRLIYLSLAGTVLLSLFVGVYLFAKKRRAKSTSPAKAVKHSVKTPADDVLAYWTADRMSHARPMPLPQVNEPEGEKRHTRNSDS